MQVPDAAAIAGVDWGDLLLRTAAAAADTGDFRRAVSLAREAVTAIDADRDPSRAALGRRHYVPNTTWGGSSWISEHSRLPRRA